MTISYVVFTRVTDRVITLIMLLNDLNKATALRDFLNAGGYFEKPVEIAGAEGLAQDVAAGIFTTKALLSHVIG